MIDKIIEFFEWLIGTDAYYGFLVFSLLVFGFIELAILGQLGVN